MTPRRYGAEDAHWHDCRACRDTWICGRPDCQPADDDICGRCDAIEHAAWMRAHGYTMSTDPDPDDLWEDQ